MPGRTSTSAMPARQGGRAYRRWNRPAYQPPGLGLKNFSYLPSTPLHSSASSGGGFFRVMFGQADAYSRLSSSHRSAAVSLSGMIASTGHSGSHTPQSMHSS